ncbi:hypothetical protein [Nisaea sediminum]|uniref:hypothetical protein n=1 Tax=Nisaea sediminum TaxID=2775867 RepID=UPI00186945D0|nr:hypothetical protein [Nisaea sediminum]
MHYTFGGQIRIPMQDLLDFLGSAGLGEYPVAYLSIAISLLLVRFFVKNGSYLKSLRLFLISNAAIKVYRIFLVSVQRFLNKYIGPPFSVQSFGSFVVLAFFYATISFMFTVIIDGKVNLGPFSILDNLLSRDQRLLFGIVCVISFVTFLIFSLEFLDVTEHNFDIKRAIKILSLSCMWAGFICGLNSIIFTTDIAALLFGSTGRQPIATSTTFTAQSLVDAARIGFAGAIIVFIVGFVQGSLAFFKRVIGETPLYYSSIDDVTTRWIERFRQGNEKAIKTLRKSVISYFNIVVFDVVGISYIFIVGTMALSLSLLAVSGLKEIAIISLAITMICGFSAVLICSFKSTDRKSTVSGCLLPIIVTYLTAIALQNYGIINFHAFYALTLFVFILPITNAITDLISFEASRFLLFHTIKNKEKEGIIVFFLIIDAVLAFVFLVFTAILLSIFIEILSSLFSDSYSNISAPSFLTLLEEVKAASIGDRFWVTVMLVTTLLPTFLHFLIAAGLLVFRFLFVHLVRWHQYSPSLPAEKDEKVSTQADADKDEMITLRHAPVLFTLGITSFVFFFLNMTLIASLDRNIFQWLVEIAYNVSRYILI